jgi:hypothetical protein
MTFAGSFEIGLTLALVLIAAYPIGAFMADVFENRRTFLAPIISPIEYRLYRIAGVEPGAEQKWFEYAISMVAFGSACMLSLYALLRLQAYLPINPQGFPGVPPTWPSISPSASSPTQTGRLMSARRRSATSLKWSASRPITFSIRRRRPRSQSR